MINIFLILLVCFGCWSRGSNFARKITEAMHLDNVNAIPNQSKTTMHFFSIASNHRIEIAFKDLSNREENQDEEAISENTVSKDRYILQESFGSNSKRIFFFIPLVPGKFEITVIDMEKEAEVKAKQESNKEKKNNRRESDQKEKDKIEELGDVTSNSAMHRNNMDVDEENDEIHESEVIVLKKEMMISNSFMLGEVIRIPSQVMNISTSGSKEKVSNFTDNFMNHLADEHKAKVNYITSISATPGEYELRFDLEEKKYILPFILSDEVADRPSIEWTGLDNFGNTCYMNASIKAFAATYKVIPKNETEVVMIFVNILNSIRLGKNGAIANSDLRVPMLRRFIKAFNDKIKENRVKNKMKGRVFQIDSNQEDAQEFFIHLIDLSNPNDENGLKRYFLFNLAETYKLVDVRDENSNLKLNEKSASVQECLGVALVNDKLPTGGVLDVSDLISADYTDRVELIEDYNLNTIIAYGNFDKLQNAKGLKEFYTKLNEDQKRFLKDQAVFLLDQNSNLYHLESGETFVSSLAFVENILGKTKEIVNKDLNDGSGLFVSIARLKCQYVEENKSVIQFYNVRKEVQVKDFNKGFILQLLRFNSDRIGNIGKNSAAVSFSEELVIKTDKGDEKFKLTASINHSGGLKNGHYWAHVRDENEWIEHNDSGVGKVNKENGSRNVYVLFYTPID